MLMFTKTRHLRKKHGEERETFFVRREKVRGGGGGGEGGFIVDLIRAVVTVRSSVWRSLVLHFDPLSTTLVCG